ncbi:DNA primase, partial [Streptomyces sp. NEAU-H3]|nr:DNA primase [Streptomyces sp. NEAU-H3]
PGARGATARPWLPEVETLLGPVVETLTRPGVNAPEF